MIEFISSFNIFELMVYVPLLFALIGCIIACFFADNGLVSNWKVFYDEANKIAQEKKNIWNMQNTKKHPNVYMWSNDLGF